MPNPKLSDSQVDLKAIQSDIAEMAKFARLNPAPVMSMDLSGTIVRDNPAAQKVFGKPSLVGESWFDLCPSCSPSDLEAFKHSGEVIQKELVLRDKLYLFSLRSAGDNVFAFGADITERRDIERQMLAAKESAEQANKAKSEFLANMSHELRTPLNGIVGMIDLLLKESLNAQQKFYARTIQGSSDALLSIVNDILDLSKIDAGKLTIEDVPFNLKAVLASVTDLLAPTARNKGVEFVARYPPTGPNEIVGDPVRIRQIVANFVSNALKFTSEGHILLHADFVDSSSDLLRLRVVVKDTGLGIAQSKKKLIWESFSQADSSTTRLYGGTGLGLTISSKLAAMMNGEVGMTSQEGRGSEFWLELPVGPVSTQQVEGSEQLLAGKTLLIVDDTEDSTKTLSELVHHWGAKTKTAPDSQTALAMLTEAADRNEAFDAALLDLVLGAENGEDLAMAIRERKGLGRVPLCILSTVEDPDLKARLQVIGADARLIKPVEESMLKESLEYLIHQDDREFLTEHLVRDMRQMQQGKSPADADQALNMRVLLVEDNAINQEVATMMLEGMGCEVARAGNGQVALDMLATESFDVVLMDCQMPVIDGYQATQKLREQDKFEDLPVIAMTANAMQGDRQICIDAGMDDYVSKPITADTLHKKLLSWRSGRRDKK